MSRHVFPHAPSPTITSFFRIAAISPSSFACLPPTDCPASVLHARYEDSEITPSLRHNTQPSPHYPPPSLTNAMHDSAAILRGEEYWLPLPPLPLPSSPSSLSPSSLSRPFSLLRQRKQTPLLCSCELTRPVLSAIYLLFPHFPHPTRNKANRMQSMIQPWSKKRKIDVAPTFTHRRECMRIFRHNTAFSWESARKTCTTLMFGAILGHESQRNDLPILHLFCRIQHHCLLHQCFHRNHRKFARRTKFLIS